jgi:hypothetical protein
MTSKLRRLTALIVDVVFSQLEISPRFHSVEEIAFSLASYYLIASGTLNCQRAFTTTGAVKGHFTLKPSGDYADEIGVRLVHGVLHWFWAVRDLNTG